MTTTDSDQGITLQQGTDPANLPSAQLAEFGTTGGGTVSRLNLRYASIADRTARHPVSIENEQSALTDVDRVEIYNGADWISLYYRSLFSNTRNGSQTVNNSTTLVDVTGITVALPTAGRFGWSTEIMYSSSTVADIKLAYTWPAGATVQWAGMGIALTAGSVEGDLHDEGQGTSGNTISFGGSGVSSPMMILIQGEIIMGGTAGNLQLRFAQNTLEASNTTIRLARQRLWREV